MALEVAPGCADLRFHGKEEVLHQFLLFHRLREVVLPPEREPGRYDGARVPEKENDRHAGEVGAHPTEEQIGPYVLDQAPPRDDTSIEPVGPGVPEFAREGEAGRLQKLLPPIGRPQVLLGLEATERADHSRIERLENVTIPPPVVDNLREPRGPAAPAPRKKDRTSVVPLPQVDVELSRQPRERDAHHRADPPGRTLDLMIIAADRRLAVNGRCYPPVLRLQRACRVGRSASGASAGGVSAAPQSFLEANFTAMAARMKKNSVEAGRYQCHSNAEETR